MRRDASGIATLTIDVAYVAKLRLCEEWDRASGFDEPHPLSSVVFLKMCYAVRRPYFVITDATLAAFLFGTSRN